MAISMNLTRILRFSRIAASAFCLVLCGFLIVLWVRSYLTRDVLLKHSSKTRSIGIVSLNAQLAIGSFASSPRPQILVDEGGMDALLAADPQIGILQNNLMMEQMRLIELSGVARGGRTKQITSQQRRIAGLQQQIAQYESKCKNSSACNRKC